jgi:hypothetical protein
MRYLKMIFTLSPTLMRNTLIDSFIEIQEGAVIDESRNSFIGATGRSMRVPY